MRRNDIVSLGFIFAAVLVVYYPVFYTDYLYTDDAGLLWFSKTLPNLTYLAQGRYITFELFAFLFSRAKTIHDLTYLRLFSLGGWLCCLPVWYVIIKKLVQKNELPRPLVVMSLLYLVCMPPFAISIGWASCLQSFIACTSGLLAGYFLYNGVLFIADRLKISIYYLIAAALCGVISLFTYQNGFGCFFVPFLLHFVSAKPSGRQFRAAIAGSLLIFGLYYLLFRYSLLLYGSGASDRSGMANDPVKKIGFFLAQPLKSAFHVGWLFNEKSTAGIIAYLVVGTGWLAAYFIRQQPKALLQKIYQLSGILILLAFIYLPSLLVKENYASNRTLLALDLVVFVLLADTIFYFLKTKLTQYVVCATAALLLLFTARYNFQQQFLMPVVKEYQLIKSAVDTGYSPALDSIYFIRPAENAFEDRFAVTRSWDEFGVPSTAKSWVPEPLLKQLIFEKTGNRQMANNIMVKSWAGTQAFAKKGEAITTKTLMINVDSLLVVPVRGDMNRND